MFLVVTGGSGSGKSEYAESRAVSLEPGEKVYIATMEPCDAESFARIGRHREMRRAKNFRTLECFRRLEDVPVSSGDVVLLECMSNLIANEMFSPDGRGERAGDAVMKGILRLKESCRHLIVVTNDVFGEEPPAEESSRRYLEVLGAVNARMARLADETVEVVCGIPVPVSGEKIAGREKHTKEKGMILVTGGAYQGKLARAAELCGKENPRIADGAVCDTEEIFAADIWNHFPLWVKRMLREEQPAEQILQRILAANPALIIVIQELGCGLVPVDLFDRLYRETCGRLSCLLASRAARVYRVTCGILQRIR